MVDVSADGISEVRVALTELAGPGAPPMVNGELLFEFPWHSRAFGMARVLCEAGIFHWDEFRRLLISNIREWEDDHSTHTYAYYDIFLQTLTMLLAEKNLCPDAELDSRQLELSARPHGHDH